MSKNIHDTEILLSEYNEYKNYNYKLLSLQVFLIHEITIFLMRHNIHYGKLRNK
jgi:hypothetical protein